MRCSPLLLCFLRDIIQEKNAVVNTKIQKISDRRNGVRRDLDKVKVLFLGKRQSVGRGHNTKLAAVSSDHAKLLVADLLVDLMF